MKAQIEITETEANQLNFLLDIALKTKGVEVMGNVSYFLNKINAPFVKVEDNTSVDNIVIKDETK